MSRRIVSWKINESRDSPAVSNASGRGSIVSINSILSDMNPEVTGVQPAEPGANFTNWRGSANPSTVESFVQHDVYFFKDGNITFLVEGSLYCVHRYFFSRDSVYFSTKFSQLDVRDHEPLATIISLGDVERKDFEAFLSVLYPENFEEHGLSYEQWKSVLNLSTRWGFTSLRKLALKSINPPTPFDRLLLARTYSVDHWVLPALSALCERKKPISLKEARQMSTEDVVLVTTVREDIRAEGSSVDMTEIKGRIEATQIRMVSNLWNDEDSAVDSENEVDDEPLKGAVTGVPSKVDSYNGTKNTAVAVPPKVVDGDVPYGSGELSTQIAGPSSAESSAGRKVKAPKKEKGIKKKSSRSGNKLGEDAGANMPQSAPTITGESEERYVSDAIPEEDGEKKPTSNLGIDHGPGASWFSNALRTADAAKFSFGPPEGSPSVPAKDSQRAPAVLPPGSQFFSLRK